MKLLIVAYKFGTEQEIGEHLGTYHYFIEKMRRVALKGHEVHVVCPWLTMTRRGSVKVDGIILHRTWPPMLNKAWAWPLNRLMRRWYMHRTQRKVLHLVKKLKCDLVYVWQARETGYALCQIKEQLGIPLIFRQITAWRWHFERTIADIFKSHRWYKVLQKAKLQHLIDPVIRYLLDLGIQVHYARTIYQKADKIVFLSNAAVDEAVSLGLDRAKADTIGVAIEEEAFKPLGIEKKALREKLGLNGHNIISFIGRLNFAEKGIGWLLSALPAVVQSVPGATLVIIGGGGEMERIKRVCRELHIEPYVQLVGKKPLNELVAYLNASDVFVVPSLWMEAFGQVTIEAMSCGVPVVTSDAGASPEINKDNVSGMVVPVNDANALSNAIITILKDETLKQRMGQAARARVIELYTYEVMVNRFLNIMQSLLPR